MRKSDHAPPDELRAGYVRADFNEFVRGKYADNSHMVAIDPDLAQSFPTAKAVNDALRALLDTQKAAAGPE
jgi:hypothetical protein